MSTTGFRADLAAFQSRAVDGTGFASRVYATNGTVGWDKSSGALLSTGRDLDVAINGPGWIAVQGADGKEAYTRAGNLQVDRHRAAASPPPASRCWAMAGRSTFRPTRSIFFARDGSISIVAQGQAPDTTATVGRIKLVNPPDADLQRGDDGLFRMKDGSDAPPDAAVQLSSGALESSNVNTAEAMVNMIELSRHFEMQVKAIRTAEENAAAASQLMKGLKERVP